MQRLAFLFVLLLSLCPPLLAQDAAVTRFAVTARFLPNSGNPVTATIPEALIGNVTIPLQISPASMWLMTVAPTRNEGEFAISIADTALVRPPAGNTAAAPVIIVQGTYPLTFGRPVTVMQTGTYRVELVVTRM